MTEGLMIGLYSGAFALFSTGMLIAGRNYKLTRYLSGYWLIITAANFSGVLWSGTFLLEHMSVVPASSTVQTIFAGTTLVMYAGSTVVARQNKNIISTIT